MNPTPHKPAIIIYGPNGSGKTHLVKQIVKNEKAFLAHPDLREFQTNQIPQDLRYLCIEELSDIAMKKLLQKEFLIIETKNELRKIEVMPQLIFTTAREINEDDFDGYNVAFIPLSHSIEQLIFEHPAFDKVVKIVEKVIDNK